MADLLVLGLWAATFVLFWSGLSVLLTFAVIGAPAILGWWRLAIVLTGSLLTLYLVFFLLALLGWPTGLPLPTRPRAGVIAFPVMAIWPALALTLILNHRRMLHASAEPPHQGSA